MLISVIVPVYNAGSFLDKSIGSVLNQSYRNLELLLIDDGSTDGSETICNSYARTDSRVKVFSQGNSGPAAARNTGLRHATGIFVSFLDADDFLDRRALEKFVDQYGKHRADMVLGNFCKLTPAGESVRQKISFHPDKAPLGFEIREKVVARAEIPDFVRHFLKHPSNHLASYCWGRLYLSAIIKEHGLSFHEDMRLFEDFVFNVQYLQHTKAIAFLNEPLYTYVMHGSHVSLSMAIVNGESLLHDMSVFRDVARDYLLRETADSGRAPRANEEVGHTLVHYAIIFLVRSCLQLTGQTRAGIRGEIGKIVGAPIIRESLRQYAPSRGNSRVVPLLMRLRWIDLLMFVCSYKASRRYGTRRGGTA